MLQILAAVRITDILAAGTAPENLVECRIRRTGEVGKIESLKAETPTRFIPRLFEDTVSVKPIDVVELSLQRITEDVVSLGDPLEAFFRMPIPRIDVRMKAARQLPKSSLDLI